MTLIARSRLLVVVLALSSLSTTGCSYLFVQRPPANFREMSPGLLNCTATPVAPAVDVAASAIHGYLTAQLLAFLVSNSNSNWSFATFGPPLLVEAGLLALHVGSASHGFTATKECRRAQEILAAQYGAPSAWSPSGLATPAMPAMPSHAPAIPLGCTNTPEFRKGSAREKKAIIDECKRRAAEAAALDTSTPIPATPSEPPPPPPF